MSNIFRTIFSRKFLLKCNSTHSLNVTRNLKSIENDDSLHHKIIAAVIHLCEMTHMETKIDLRKNQKQRTMIKRHSLLCVLSVDDLACFLEGEVISPNVPPPHQPDHQSTYLPT